MCHRYYCYFCLKGSYDTLAENIKDNNAWLCPYCAGTCYCTRCMRNEKMLQLIAYFFSIDGDINYLYNELINKNSIIDELFSNFIMNNIYLVLYDKNLTPAQMVDNFINYDINQLGEIQTKEDEIINLKNYIEILYKQKEEIHKEFSNIYKDKYEVKQKYDLINGKDLNDEINDDIEMINNNYSSYEKEEELPKVKVNIKLKEKEENYFKYKNEESDNNQSKEDIDNDKKEGIQTRKKEKIVYYKDKYYSRRKEKKIVRKNEDKILRNSNKYYIKNK